MANFDSAFAITAAHEGGYSDDPVDVGGETYRGISRRFNPSWQGWKIIDDLKDDHGAGRQFRSQMADHPELNEMVKHFYKSQYWDRFWGDNIPDQQIAEELFDTGVNMGVSRGVTFLQESINLLNRNQQNYSDIVEDGVFGPSTLGALETCLASENNDSAYIMKIMNVLQGMHYIDYMKSKPSQEKYARGWLKRVSI